MGKVICTLCGNILTAASQVLYLLFSLLLDTLISPVLDTFRNLPQMTFRHTLWINKKLTCRSHELELYYRSGTVNSNTVNSKFHLIRSYCEIFFYHFPNILCLKCTVNSNFHLIRSKTLLTKDFELTVPDLYQNGSTNEAACVVGVGVVMLQHAQYHS